MWGNSVHWVEWNFRDWGFIRFCNYIILQEDKTHFISEMQKHDLWLRSRLSSEFYELMPDIAHSFLPQKTHFSSLLFTDVTYCNHDWLTCRFLSALACFNASSHWGSPTSPNHLKVFLIAGHLTRFWLMAGGKWVLALLRLVFSTHSIKAKHD